LCSGRPACARAKPLTHARTQTQTNKKKATGSCRATCTPPSPREGTAAAPVFTSEIGTVVVFRKGQSFCDCPERGQQQMPCSPNNSGLLHHKTTNPQRTEIALSSLHAALATNTLPIMTPIATASCSALEAGDTGVGSPTPSSTGCECSWPSSHQSSSHSGSCLFWGVCLGVLYGWGGG
jgi:hypothetical protein